eukprot:TRINITY_DN100572_c0_g1_i1.p2 TRINITY_DN100572_c0_g1~~TRINITY_DN100572_c0_g1_i1.p2  ORF type:complete len:140 (+),score=32.37 TRINITY_DN100572_c0_g1_i1:46-465(+)
MPKTSARSLRPSLTPGTVCIILAGRFRGRRVVYLKQLEKSGVLLVTGPYKLNGVPIRRVDPAYVIATSTKVDVSKVSADVNDDFFAAAKADSEGTLAKRKEVQKSVDTQLLSALNADQKKYLSSFFSLSNKDKPHEMVF